MGDSLLDELLARSRDEAGGLRLTGEDSMLGELIRAVLERALEAELTAHLGYGKHDRGGAGNARNGTIAKTVQTGVGPVPLQVPRDRAGTFEPLLVPKRAGRVSGGLDDMIVSLYARDVEPGHHLPPAAGLRDRAVGLDRLRGHRRGTRGGEGVAVPAAGTQAVYAVVFLDAIVVKVRDNQVASSWSASARPRRRPPGSPGGPVSLCCAPRPGWCN
jgi:putative transposase